MSKEFKINFNASGWISQDCTLLIEDITPKDVVAGLNKGKYITTVHGDVGYIEETASGRKIAKIENTDNDLEYEDFELTD